MSLQRSHTAALIPANARPSSRPPSTMSPLRRATSARVVVSSPQGPPALTETSTTPPLVVSLSTPAEALPAQPLRNEPPARRSAVTREQEQPSLTSSHNSSSVSATAERAPVPAVRRRPDGSVPRVLEDAESTSSPSSAKRKEPPAVPLRRAQTVSNNIMMSNSKRSPSPHNMQASKDPSAGESPPLPPVSIVSVATSRETVREPHVSSVTTAKQLLVPAVEAAVSQPHSVADSYQRPLRRAVVPDSPSSPVAGKRLALGPTHSFVLNANTDVPIVDPQTHLPSEVGKVRGLGLTAQSVDCSAADTALHALSSQMNRIPLVSPDKPAPPPYLLRGDVTSSSGAPHCLSAHVESSAASGYAPEAARWQLLNTTAQRSNAESTNESSAAGVSKYEPQSTAPKTTPAFAACDDSFVTCVVLIVASEDHYDADACFDPVAEVRVTRCDMAKVTVGRMLDLIHKSLNYEPRRRGVLRLVTSENVGGVSATTSGLQQHQQRAWVLLQKEGAPLAEYVNTDVFRFQRKSQDRVVKLRWIEDGSSVSSQLLRDAQAESANHHISRGYLQGFVLGATTRAEPQATQPILAGYKTTPIVEEESLARSASMADRALHAVAPRSSWTRADPALGVREASYASFVTVDDNASQPFFQNAAFALQTGSESVVPQLVVPSRSSSRAGTPTPPQLSPVRHVHPVAATPTPVMVASRNGSRLPSPSVQSSDALAVDAQRRVFDATGVQRAPMRPLVALTSPALEGENLSRSTTESPLRRAGSIVVDGVLYTPKSAAALKLAEEIAALRAAIDERSSDAD